MRYKPTSKRKTNAFLRITADLTSQEQFSWYLDSDSSIPGASLLPATNKCVDYGYPCDYVPTPLLLRVIQIVPGVV